MSSDDDDDDDDNDDDNDVGRTRNRRVENSVRGESIQTFSLLCHFL